MKEDDLLESIIAMNEPEVLEAYYTIVKRVYEHEANE